MRSYILSHDHQSLAFLLRCSDGVTFDIYCVCVKPHYMSREWWINNSHTQINKHCMPSRCRVYVFVFVFVTQSAGVGNAMYDRLNVNTIIGWCWIKFWARWDGVGWRRRRLSNCLTASKHELCTNLVCACSHTLNTVNYFMKLRE